MEEQSQINSSINIQDFPRNGFSRDKDEMKFTYDFVQKLIQSSQTIDVDIINEMKDPKPNQ